MLLPRPARRGAQRDRRRRRDRTGRSRSFAAAAVGRTPGRATTWRSIATAAAPGSICPATPGCSRTRARASPSPGARQEVEVPRRLSGLMGVRQQGLLRQRASSHQLDVAGHGPSRWSRRSPARLKQCRQARRSASSRVEAGMFIAARWPSSARFHLDDVTAARVAGAPIDVGVHRDLGVGAPIEPATAIETVRNWSRRCPVHSPRDSCDRALGSWLCRHASASGARRCHQVLVVEPSSRRSGRAGTSASVSHPTDQRAGRVFSGITRGWRGDRSDPARPRTASVVLVTRSSCRCADRYRQGLSSGRW